MAGEANILGGLLQGFVQGRQAKAEREDAAEKAKVTQAQAKLIEAQTKAITQKQDLFNQIMGTFDQPPVAETPQPTVTQGPQFGDSFGLPKPQIPEGKSLVDILSGVQEQPAMQPTGPAVQGQVVQPQATQPQAGVGLNLSDQQRMMFLMAGMPEFVDLDTDQKRMALTKRGQDLSAKGREESLALATAKGVENEFIDSAGDFGTIGAKYEQRIDPVTKQPLEEPRMVEMPPIDKITTVHSDKSATTVFVNKLTGEQIGEPIITQEIPAKSTENAGKIATVKIAIEDFPIIRNFYLNQDGSFRASMKDVGAAQFKVPGTDGRRIQFQLMKGIDAKSRAMTGAAMTIDEERFYTTMFVPSIFDSEQTKIDKIKGYGDFLNRFLVEADPGSFTKDELKELTMSEFAPDKIRATGLAPDDVSFLTNNPNKKVEFDDGSVWAYDSDNDEFIQIK